MLREGMESWQPSELDLIETCVQHLHSHVDTLHQVANESLRFRGLALSFISHEFSCRQDKPNRNHLSLFYIKSRLLEK